jgi:vancomycin resistance protein YoaR
MNKLKAATIKKIFSKKRLVNLATTALSIIIVLVLSFLGYALAYANRVYPNIYVGGVKVSGLKKEAVKENLKIKIQNSKLEKIVLSYQDKSWELAPSQINLQYNLDKSVEKAWEIGRRPSFKQSLKEQILSLFRAEKLGMENSFDEEKVQDKIKEIAKDIDIPERVVSFVLENGEIKTIPPQEGQKVLQEETMASFKKSVGNFQENVPLVVVKLVPKINEDQTEQMEEAKAAFSKMVANDLILKYQDQEFIAEPEKIQKWAKFVEKPGSVFNYVLGLELNNEAVYDYLDSIAKKIDKEPVDAKLTIQDGRAVVFQAHQDGYKLDKEDALKKIKEILLGGGEQKREIQLKVQTLKPSIRTETINELGIKELIGEGSSYFKGSPPNRIHNITVGANIFNGVLIKPGDIFSFNQILGEVSPQKGYLPELVIKEDRLIPETGGGLCQVSTTMFRAAVYSGLEILERTPHSFRVRYYEPPVGLDATVYSPKPDLKFKNDTPGYILIQTKIEGTKLTFQFYGTKDGRTVEVKGPYTLDYRSPGEPIYIDDPSLPAGEIKQIEKAVPGLTATIYWTVYRGGQVLHQKTFVSKYVPWPAKYKRGTGPAPTPSEQPPPEQPPASE